MVISNLAPDTDYAINVRARDAAGNWSNWSGTRVVHTSEGTGSASNQSVWLDIDGDGIRDEIIRADTTRFNYTIATWWTDYELYWEYDVNQYWTPWDFAWATGYSETGFTPVWEPTWYYFPSFSYTRTYANLAFTVDAELGYDYIIEADTSGSGTVNPAHWHSIFGTMSFPNPGPQNVLWGNVDLDEVYYTQFFYVRLGKPVGSVSLSSLTGTVLGQAVSGVPLRVTLPSDGTLILSVKDLLGKVLKNGPQIQWTVLDPVSGQTLNPWHIADYLNLGVNGSGQWLVG